LRVEYYSITLSATADLIYPSQLNHCLSYTLTTPISTEAFSIYLLFINSSVIEIIDYHTKKEISIYFKIFLKKKVKILIEK